MKKALALASLALFASAVNAEAIEPAHNASGFYLGAGIGSTAFDSLDSGKDVDMFMDALKEDGNTTKIIAGIQFGRVFALEGQYTQYGDIKAKETDIFSMSPTAISLAANLGYSYSNGLRPFGVIGISVIDLGLSIKDSLLAEIIEDEKGVGFHYGLGLEYAPAMLKGLTARVGYEADLFAIEFQDPRDYYYSETKAFTLGSAYAAVSYKF